MKRLLFILLVVSFSSVSRLAQAESLEAMEVIVARASSLREFLSETSAGR